MATDFTQYRALASLFSRRFFTEIKDRGDISRLVEVWKTWGSGRSRCRTAEDYLNWAYGVLVKNYACEYVYKNEFLNRVVLKNRLGKDCVVVSEFKAAGSIADFAVFGERCEAFEIKTTLDTPRRLAGQLASYAKLFQTVTLIVPVEAAEKYQTVTPSNIGLIGMFNDPKGILHVELRPAVESSSVDPRELMKVLHTEEYRRAVASYFGALPACSDLEMYAACEKKVAQMPTSILQNVLLESVKHRQQRVMAMTALRRTPRILRQMMLSMRFSKAEIDKIVNQLSISLEDNVCISRI